MLARLQKALKENDKGFTLIELLVVIVIIGILAAIAIPLFLNQRKKGVDASLKSDLRSAATTLESFSTNSTTTPTYLAQTVAGGTQGTGPLAEFTTSEGNTVKLKGGTAGVYTLCAFNPGASVATDGGIGKNLVYDPAMGGLQTAPGAVAC